MKKLISIVCLMALAVEVFAVKLPGESYFKYGKLAEADNAILSTGVQILNNSTVGTAIYSQCYFPDSSEGTCEMCCEGALYDVDDEDYDTLYGKCIDYCMGASLPLDSSVGFLLLLAVLQGIRCYRRIDNA